MGGTTVNISPAGGHTVLPRREGLGSRGGVGRFLQIGVFFFPVFFFLVSPRSADTMSVHLAAASITPATFGNEVRSMLRIRAENGRLLAGVKWPALLFQLWPPRGIGPNIDMQHYKTRLLSGCGVMASWLSFSPSPL